MEARKGTQDVENSAIDGLAAQIAGRDAESPWQGDRRTKREKIPRWQTRFPRAAAALARRKKRAKTTPAHDARSLIVWLTTALAGRA
ncbi:hypothetical protein [Methylobacterium soli]|uniref:Uncharacterized protein n=1 Tax=Methylobacterium soli TaxID=553447 RepID=A0A6L3SX03_9HYPH|nr:hypothetical protein [Methylobacterium soli]KAB1076680.1 hypothetical protein F6X53_22580 [Methylobacterium soli]GJE45462.1 hypothetical protein AEGHOMDF_4657 [Methylobacterium soli]